MSYEFYSSRRHPHRLVCDNADHDRFGFLIDSVSMTTTLRGIGLLTTRRADVPRGDRERFNFNVIRLRFQAYIFTAIDPRHYITAPVFTSPIYNLSASPELKIKVCTEKGSVKGGDQIIMLTEKVRRCYVALTRQNLLHYAILGFEKRYTNRFLRCRWRNRIQQDNG